MNYFKGSVRNRNKLLQAVKSEVKARLEQSLHNAVRVILLKETQPEQMPRLWDIDVKIGRRPTFQLPPETSILEVFEETGGKLMILGTAGSGKTTTLLELANELITAAENDISKPIPVLLNLLSWQQNNQPIADWLIAELNSRYGVPVKVSKRWIKEQQILPLLDGLDELELTQQEQCQQRINELLAGENPPKHLVVCTRMENYKSCNTKLRLHGAVYLRHLSETQIKEYLMKSRSRELWENIKTEPPLLELAKNPLFLNMMALAYEEILIHAWRRIAAKDERREYLLNAYIRRMLTRDMESQFYRQGKQPRPEQMRPWLTWLAKRMSELNQQEFTLEKIDRHWLQTSAQKRLYRMGVLLSLGGILMSKKAIVRTILAKNGYIPKDYPRFLGLATERLFVQKVSGRYRFVHELLQRYLGQLPS
ncbi:NACHT domain-containing protein [Aerosakkonema funiforme]|uniref:NACHT domain-containing protein n=1 Tax=Aerosakkonema funiforme FACHB-1375 TaxID=2949571 RepID=A0A926VFL0_9CYAN|nr:NACHT domain-containing protein [Aerosakkonema funiforme]MBD2182989.1 NACHT domain-containing protein [Aerosakkonema funiforme FACHB-1375]